MRPTVKILAILGPTATGKTSLGVAAAHNLGVPILSADSRQVYRGLDLGTGKDLAEYASVDPPVPYHLIDIADPRDNYTLFDYQRDCFSVIRDLLSDAAIAGGEKPLVMVGGSGLYAEAVLRRYELADVDEDVDLRRRLADVPINLLQERLEKESPEIFERTDTSSRRRLIRGLEVAAAAAEGPVETTGDPGFDLDVRVAGIEVDRVLLRSRIATRLAERLRAGMVEEVRELLDGGLPPARLNSLGLEYREIGIHLAGGKSYREMVADLRTRINRFAKRQQTWFRGMPRRGLEIRWIPPGDLDGLTDMIRGW